MSKVGDRGCPLARSMMKFTKLQCFIGTTHSPENNDKAAALQQIAASHHTVLSLMRRKMWIVCHLLPIASKRL
ncbi:hypothetical protein J6590_099027, partial [Homalodisca vitripennis]